MDEKLTAQHIREWRKQLEIIASDTRVPKRFQVSPEGRCVVTIGTTIVFDGSDETLAIRLYNSH